MDSKNVKVFELEIRFSLCAYNLILYSLGSIVFTIGYFVFLIRTLDISTDTISWNIIGICLLGFLCCYLGPYGLILHVLSYRLYRTTNVKLDRETGAIVYSNIRKNHIIFNVADIVKCTDYCPTKMPAGYYEIELNNGQKIYVSDYTDITPILKMNPEIEQESRTPLFLNYARIRNQN